MKKIEWQFGKKLRELRLVRGLSHEKLVFKSRMHRTYLGGIERGERNPSLKNTAAIAKTLNVTLAQLFSFDDLSSRGRQSVQCNHYLGRPPVQISANKPTGLSHCSVLTISFPGLWKCLGLALGSPLMKY